MDGSTDTPTIDFLRLNTIFMIRDSYVIGIM